MKTFLFTILSILVLGSASAQDKLQGEVKPIIAEGKAIYRLEMANRIGSKLFNAAYKGKEPMAGLISYPVDDNVVTLFYSGGEKQKAIGTILFDSSYEEDKAKVDMAARDITQAEMQLIRLYSNAKKLTQDAANFTLPENATFNLVPMMSDNTGKVYVMTVSSKDDVVIFGNDYLLKYDSKLNLTDKKALHKNMAAVSYDKNAGTANDTGSTHTHLAAEGEMVSATDIATLFLYEKLTKWSQHTFISENYIFFWNYGTHDLQVISKAPPRTK